MAHVTPDVLGRPNGSVSSPHEEEDSGSDGGDDASCKEGNVEQDPIEDLDGVQSVDEIDRLLAQPGQQGKTMQAEPGAAQPQENKCMKWSSLAFLTLQTSFVIVFLQWTRIARNGVVLYLPTTLVVMVELLKTFLSFLLVSRDEGGLSTGSRLIYNTVAEDPCNVLKAAVPSLVYVVQNNLQYYSVEKLGAPVQQVVYQMKTITTAGIGVLMLGRSLTYTKWVACCLLSVGIAMVQWPRESQTVQAQAAARGKSTEAHAYDQITGLVAVVVSCLTSGFAGVYIEKMLTRSSQSIWMRNIQFGAFGAITGLAVAFIKDGAAIAKDGFFQGYSWTVFWLWICNTAGGLGAALMLKYAGATLGCFSTALSVVLTDLLSWAIIGDIVFDALFYSGSAVAIGATLMFGLGLPDWAYSLCSSDQSEGKEVPRPSS